MSLTAVGYLVVAILWFVVLVPIVHSLIRFVRTTRLSELKVHVRRVPRVARVPDCHNVRMVSAQRARLEPACFEQVTPWAWRHK